MKKGRAISSCRRTKPYPLQKRKVLYAKGLLIKKRVRAKQEFADEVFRLVNLERTSRGLNPLVMLEYRVADMVYTDYLGHIATIKAADMRDNNYFSHDSPTYGTPGEMLTRFGVNWTANGENIAAGYPTPQAVMTAWMNSPVHRANILNPNFTYLGVGYVPGNATSTYAHYWVQLFVRL
ncbi:CAP domain-containing protein [Paenibacillus sp. SC116]|uniref:CAP domain-containing protein n=1 Tax=Paenibacillus sp. SC116 TaxID=2968986 RepID=UPI00215AF0E4|nr:CAP domain-containing protein [Paenibacillus sp. SC116]MCR8842630.1 CAP domain-containing protein [Paenibacillus sp. SC116]